MSRWCSRLLIFEQLGLAAFWVNQVMIIGPVLFYLIIGLMVRTTNLEDFFVAGERVPALYNGLSISANVLGAARSPPLGALVFLGYDGLPLVLGWCAGLAMVAILFAPHTCARPGSFTMPGFLGMRFSSRPLRATAALFSSSGATAMLLAPS